MASQWGRDSAGAMAGRSQAGRLLLGLFIGLLLGFGAAYAGLRIEGLLAEQTLRSEEAGRIAALQERLAETERLKGAAEAARAEAERQLHSLPPASAIDPLQIEALRRRLSDQTRDLDSLTERLAAESAARRNAAGDVERLGKALAAAEAARDAGGREGERERAGREEAAKRAAAAEAAAKDLTRRLEAAESTARAALDEAAASKAAFSQLSSRSDREKADLAAALAEARQRVAALDEAVRTGKADAERLRIALAEARSQEKEPAPERAPQEMALPAPVTPRPNEIESVPPPLQAPPPSGPPTAPRDAGEVARVLDATPGIGALSAERRQMLREQLVSGACVSAALGAAFDRVPVVTLRNLIRDLKSGC